VQVTVGQRRADIRGRVCMDQFVVDLGPAAADVVGDDVILFGPGRDGEPTAMDWARWCDTIGYEIVTRIGVRVPRRYVEEDL
jgi:alanine racemase